VIKAGISEMNKNDFDAPNGVVITNNHDEMPVYPLHPPLRSPLRRSAGRVELVLLEQLTRGGKDKVLSVPDVLGINGETQIGLARASRIMQSGQTSAAAIRLSGACSLCDDTRREDDRPALQVDNARPFGPLLHKVIFSRTHIDSLENVGMDEVLDSTEQFYEIAKESATMDKVSDGLVIGMNFGEYLRSGASQIHFHYQITGLGPANYNAGDRLGALCRAYRQVHADADYLTDYETALQEADLIVAESTDHLAFAYSPISPRFKGEVQIMLRQRHAKPQAGNILETTTEERKALAELQYVIIRRFGLLGCSALNQVWYTTRFSENNECGQRLIISICPRTSVIAFYELFGNSVIDTVPWRAAQTLRMAEPLHFSLRA
jgi:galactose-1-phosphate uridylyltransferase